MRSVNTSQSPKHLLHLKSTELNPTRPDDVNYVINMPSFMKSDKLSHAC